MNMITGKMKDWTASLNDDSYLVRVLIERNPQQSTLLVWLNYLAKPSPEQLMELISDDDEGRSPTIVGWIKIPSFEGRRRKSHFGCVYCSDGDVIQIAEVISMESYRNRCIRSLNKTESVPC